MRLELPTWLRPSWRARPGDAALPPRSLRFAHRRGPTLALLFSPLLIAGCGGMRLSGDTAYGIEFDPFTWFPGQTRAWGIVQDWRGRVTRRFEVDIAGSVTDGVLTLDEDFRFGDGSTDKRVWRIRRDGGDALSGVADDIVGTAAGSVVGNAMQWRYAMDLEVDGSTYRVKFDDRLWQISDAVLVNRAAIKKFGLTVGEVTLFMHKQDG